MPRSTKQFCASPPAAPAKKGRWLVLIGGNGETSADEIEDFFAEMWPDVELKSTGDEAPGSSAGIPSRPAAAKRAH